jgi:peroxiredoxin
VEGSEESVKLAQVEKDYADALIKLSDLSSKLMTATGAEADAAKRQMGQEYINYYRSRVRYVMENSKSLTVVPVLFQNFGSDLPVFGQSTDAIQFTNVADSLEMVYPDSRYVKALRAEAKRRMDYMELETRLNSAEEIGYPDIVLPDVNANKIRLSEVDSKVVMLFFWSSADASQKMFNLDFLKSVYEDYHKKGLEIYQVSLDVDKAAWARVVKEQKLPWINVCDSRGSASPYVLTYNIGSLPAVYVISDGELVDGEMSTEKSFRRRLEQLLK